MKTWGVSEDPYDTAPSILHLGFAWEQYILNRSNLGHEPEYRTVWQPGELQLTLSNGEPVYATPDAFTTGLTWKSVAPSRGQMPLRQVYINPEVQVQTKVTCIDDAKYTLKKPFDDTLPLHWVYQASAYLYGYEQTLGIRITHFRFFVTHAAGNYLSRKKDPEERKGATSLPIYHLYWLEFTWEEICNNWRILDDYATRNYDRLLVAQRESHNAAWQRQTPGFRDDLVLPDPFAPFTNGK